MELIDTHAHVLGEYFSPTEVEEVLARAHDAHVSAVVNVGTDMKTSREVVAFAARTDRVWATVGVHPHEASVFAHGASEVLRELRDLAQHPSVVAVGECGLDYHYDHSPRDVQRQALRLQIELAGEIGKPLVLHNRESDADLLAILTEVGLGAAGGVVHAFSSSEEMAGRCLSLGLHLGFGGIVTFKTADGVRKSLKSTPLDRILLETDSPYLTPAPFRGQRNEPRYVRLVAERVAVELQATLETVAEATSRNARGLFGLT